MPVIIEKPTGEFMQTADQDYFLDAEGNVTTDEESAAFVLIRQGQEIPKDMADKYGIGKVAQSDGEAEDVSEKSAKADTLSANKSDKPTKNKGVK